MTVQEYFALDYTAPDARYEYQDGKVRLMAGGSGEHDEIAYNTRVALNQQFQTGPCFVRGSDMRVLVAEDTYFFPDVTVSCDVADRRRGNTLIRSARTVVEVLSPSTEKIDRTDKLKTYQAWSSIQEIVLVSQFSPHVEVYRRNEEEGSSWSQQMYGPGEEMMLESLDICISLDEIYQGIDFDEPLMGE